ncbi:MAG: hypothetical protein KIS91_02240 [Anaerolineae bacterium]|nr:hypothetical protein [Anaerolineae bacterium]
MRALFRLCLVAFCAGLGAVVALKLGSEAMAVVVGVLMGVLSSLPVALLVLYATRRQSADSGDEGDAPASRLPQVVAPTVPYQPPMPQIVVVPAPSLPGYRPMPSYWETPATPPLAPREFHVVGDDESAPGVSP